TSQLSFTDVSGLTSPKSTFNVRFNGTLLTNTIYNGKIIVVDPTGKGTTNTFVFDTFKTNGTLIAEAEDYNYNNGTFQDNPPVSGLDPNRVQVNGFPTGYYGAVGTPDVDFFDTSGSSDFKQYRSGDLVGT